MQTLRQTSGKNFRECTILDDGILFKASLNGDIISKKFQFTRIGPVAEDYEYSTVREYRYSPAMQRVVLIAGIVLAFTCFGIGSSLQPSTADKVSAASGVFFGVGWVAFLLGVTNRWYQVRKVRIRKVFFAWDSFITFYARDQKDTDQIESFLSDFDKKQLSYLKHRFLEEIETKAAVLGDLLEYLNERDQFTPKEYRDYKERILKTSQKNDDK